MVKFVLGEKVVVLKLPETHWIPEGVSVTVALPFP